MAQRRIEEYAEIISLSRPVSKTHPPMSVRDRAAQFAPFSALTGLHEAADRTAHLHVQEIEERHGASVPLDKASKGR